MEEFGFHNCASARTRRAGVRTSSRLSFGHQPGCDERSGGIRAVGSSRWVIRARCADARQWPVKVALPGPCSRKLATPVRASSVRNTSTKPRTFEFEAVGERSVEPVVDHALADGVRRQRSGGDLAGQRERALHQRVRRHDLVGETDPQRFVRADLTAGQAQLLGPARADAGGAGAACRRHPG